LGQPPKADGLLAAFAARGIPVKAVDVASPVARDLYERDIVVCGRISMSPGAATPIRRTPRSSRANAGNRS